MKFYNPKAEQSARKAGYDVASYETACMDYAQIVHDIACMYRRFDDDTMSYQMVIDKKKHAAHNRVVSAIERNEAELRRLGLDPIYQGQLINGFVASQQEAGKFAMEFCGYAADVEFAN